MLGKHSGRHALKQRIADLGYQIDEAQVQRMFEEFKVLADRKKIIYDADIEALAENQLHSGPSEVWTLVELHLHGQLRGPADGGGHARSTGTAARCASRPSATARSTRSSSRSSAAPAWS